jgi:DNA-binding transcriptional MerR regulator
MQSITPAERTTLNTPEQTAKRLGIRSDTLRHWRWKGVGLDFVRVGGRIFYSDASIEAYLRSRTITIRRGGAK